MKNIERIALGLVLGAIPPAVGFLTFWWSIFAFLHDHLFPYATLGLIAGLIVDIRYLKKWIAHAYDFDLKIWMAIYGFYSVCCFGFFMGVPVFNLVLAIPAGFFIGRKLGYLRATREQYHNLTRRTCVFTSLVLGVICLAAAIIALTDPYTGANLRGMLNLSFEVTPMMIVGIIVLGGVTLLGLQWWITSKTIEYANRLIRS